MKVTIEDIKLALELQEVLYEDIKQVDKKQLFIVTTKDCREEKLFFSYESEIGYIRDNKIYISHPEGWSVTTKRHIKYFEKYYKGYDIIRF